MPVTPSHALTDISVRDQAVTTMRTFLTYAAGLPMREGMDGHGTELA